MEGDEMFASDALTPDFWSIRIVQADARDLRIKTVSIAPSSNRITKEKCNEKLLVLFTCGIGCNNSRALCRLEWCSLLDGFLHQAQHHDVGNVYFHFPGGWGNIQPFENLNSWQQDHGWCPK
jgi:hypothetical protein